MLLDDRGPEGDRRHRDPDAERVVGKADLAAERLAKRRDRADVRVGRARRIRAGAFEEHQVAAPGLARGAHQRVDLAQRRHPCRDDDRLARRCHPADERQIGVLEARDLVAGRVERLEEVHRAVVERRAERDHPVTARAREDRCVPLPRRVRLLVQVVQAAARPGARRVGDDELAVPDVERHRVGGVCLDLQCVGAARGGRIDDRQGTIERAVVVAGELGDDERWCVRSNFASFDPHGSLPRPTARW